MRKRNKLKRRRLNNIINFRIDRMKRKMNKKLSLLSLRKIDRVDINKHKFLLQINQKNK